MTEKLGKEMRARWGGGGAACVVLVDGAHYPSKLEVASHRKEPLVVC